MISAIINLIATFLGLFKKPPQATPDQLIQAGVDKSTAKATQEIVHEVEQATQIRADVERTVAAKPDSLRDDDGFERR